MVRTTALLFLALFFSASCQSQHGSDAPLTRQDSLRGSITPERAWWDVLHYNITVEPDYERKSIKGINNITFRTSESGSRMQIDLQTPMNIDAVEMDSERLSFKRDGNAWFIKFNKPLAENQRKIITVKFSGTPREAVNPPWDGGWIWKKDSYGNPWMSVACQGLGASVWYPCKDHQSDEPDSASITMIVPDTLIAVSNGRMRSSEKLQGKMRYTWAVVNPINNYNIIPYIGRYVNWTDTLHGEKGNLDLSYWVLAENVEKAKRQFKQVKPMLRCFEHWFGPYPFYEDGYKLVESPHLGMEHQSGIAYGNGFGNGYLGKDLSGTGWGKKWDFIIIHESAHEWFGNNLTTKDIADMWVHEGFTNYSEVLFTTCEYGIAAGNAYLLGLRNSIQNDKPLIAAYGVNREGSVDMYPKGANLIHIVRQLIDDDEKFRTLLRSINRDFFHQNVTSEQLEKYIIEKTGLKLSKVFDQYLRTVQIPVLEYKVSGNKLRFRWTNCVEGFDMRVRIKAGEQMWVSPGTEWKEINISSRAIIIDPNFYIGSRQL